jgi:hypothetical protein
MFYASLPPEIDSGVALDTAKWISGAALAAITAWYALKAKVREMEIALLEAQRQAVAAHSRLDRYGEAQSGQGQQIAILGERIKGVDDYARETRLVGLHNTRNELGDRLSRLEEWKDDHGGKGA